MNHRRAGGTPHMRHARGAARFWTSLVLVLVSMLVGGLAASPVLAGQDTTATSEVTIVVWACPEGTDVKTVSAGDCTNATSDVTFTLGGGPMSLKWTTGSLENSGTVIDSLAPDTYTITQTSPGTGAHSLHWRCGALGASGSGAGASSGESNTLELTTEPGVDYRCDWYSIATGGTPAATPVDVAGAVNVVTHLCPVGTDLSSAVDELLDHCVASPPDDLTVSVSITDNPPTMMNGKGSSLDDRGIAEFTFTDLPVGPIIILQTIPEGYGDPNAFCSDTGAGITELEEPTSWTERVQWILRADADAPLTCHFFNVPLDDQADGTPVVAAPRTGTVRAVAYVCPEGVSRADARYLDGDDCHAGYDNPIAFTVTDGGAYTSTQETVYDPSGLIYTEFTDVPFGTISISQSDPGGFGPPVVLCSDTYAGTIPSFYDVVPFADDGTVTIDLRADAEEQLTCLFYSFPIENTVRIAAYLCPPDVGRSGNDGLLAYNCQQEFDEPLVFTVGDTSTFATSATATADTGNVLQAELTDVPVGTISITETLPDGYGEPIVFCSDTYSGDPGLYENVTVVDGDTVTWELRSDAEEPLTCLFFNFQDGHVDTSPGLGTVNATAFACPASVQMTDDVQALAEQCSDPIDPVTFSVSDGVAYSDTQPGSGEAPSSIELADIPAGKITLMEWVPDGYGEPFAFCSSDPASGVDGYSPVALDFNDGSIPTANLTFALRPDAPVSCVFFNVPLDTVG